MVSIVYTFSARVRFINIIHETMGCGTSVNAVAPLHFNQNGSAVWNNKLGSEVLTYMTTEEMKQADIKAQEAKDLSSIRSLTEGLCKDAKSKAMCVRAFYKWISDNIRYDPKNDCTDLMSILSSKVTSSEGHASLFEQMCRLKDIKVIKISSYVEDYSYKLDYGHIDDKRRFHAWNAVLIDDTYHYVDCAWAALPISGNKKLNDEIEDVEHFFFTASVLVGDIC